MRDITKYKTLRQKSKRSKSRDKSKKNKIELLHIHNEFKCITKLLMLQVKNLL